MTIIKTENFCGSRMRMARVFHNIKLDELAELTKMEKVLLWKFEKEVEQPTKEQEKIIADALWVEPIFFHQIETSPITEDDCTFSVRMRHS